MHRATFADGPAGLLALHRVAVIDKWHHEQTAMGR